MDISQFNISKAREIVNSINSYAAYRSRACGHRTPAQVAEYRDKFRGCVNTLIDFWSTALSHKVLSIEAIALSFLAIRVNEEWSAFSDYPNTVKYLCRSFRASKNLPAGVLLTKETMLAATKLMENGELRDDLFSKSLESDCVRLLEGEFITVRNYVQMCGFCGVGHSKTPTHDNSTITYFSGYSEGQGPTGRNYGCSKAQESLYFCTASNVYYIDTTTRAILEGGRSICVAAATAIGWFPPRNDASFWTAPPRPVEIPSYRSGNRSYTRQILGSMEGRTPTTELDRMFGLEVEIWFPNSTTRGKWFAENQPSNATMERDGSLDSSRSIEVISPPLSLSEWRSPDNWFLKLLKSAQAAGAQGWSQRATHGIHVNADLRGVTPDACGLFYTLVNQLKPLYTAVSGRGVVYNGSYVVVGRPRTFSDLYSSIGNEHQMGTKYQPVRMSIGGTNPMAEVRTFGSNLRPGAALECIELVSATLQLAISLDAMNNSFHRQGFRDSIEGNTAATSGIQAPAALVWTSPMDTFLNSVFSDVEKFPALVGLLARFGVTPTNRTVALHTDSSDDDSTFGE